MARIQYTIDDKKKNLAESILKQQGIPPKVAIELFYSEIILHKGIPFQPSPVLNEQTQEAIFDARSNNEMTTFENPKAMFEDLGI